MSIYKDGGVYDDVFRTASDDDMRFVAGPFG